MGKKSLRHKEILALLSDQPTLRISEVASFMGVTRETIRRDYMELDEDGLIDRMYGGALLRPNPETDVGQRNDLLFEERKVMAGLAWERLRDAQSIMLGSGSTTQHIARKIGAFGKDMTVIVHSIDALTMLERNPNITIIMAPGVYHAGERAVHGVRTAEFLESYGADWCVVGASGIDTEGASDALPEGADIYRCMVRRASRCMVLADSSKVGRRFAARYGDWPQVSTLISEKALPEDLAAIIRSHGTEIVTPAAE